MLQNSPTRVAHKREKTKVSYFTTCATCSLLRTRLTDPFDRETVDPDVGVVPLLFRDSAIDDILDPGQRDRRFGHVRCEDDLARVRRRRDERESLFRCWKLCVKGRDEDLITSRARSQCKLSRSESTKGLTASAFGNDFGKSGKNCLIEAARDSISS